VKACEKTMPTALALFEEAVDVVKGHVGSASKILATFGLSRTQSREARGSERCGSV
jgi:hypothetical protein